MNVWKNKFVPFLWAFGGVMALVPTVKQIIKEEPVAVWPLVVACMFFFQAVIFGVACNRANLRKKELKQQSGK